MNNRLSNALSSIRIKSSEWKFIDLRINIPPDSYGSDAINPHTQYSNPVAIFKNEEINATGASFTLGEGNKMVCEAADYILQQFEGMTVLDLISSEKGFYDSLANPLQLRWLSPNSGLPLMAAGLIVNTLVDAASKLCGLPAWEYLAKLPSEYLINLTSQRHLPAKYSKEKLLEILDRGLKGIDDRCEILKQKGLPVYYTTWIGHDAESVANQIRQQYNQRGIRQFKIKIGTDIQRDKLKIHNIANKISDDVVLCVDANQTLSIDDAINWMSELSMQGILWLEEPFAPDNLALFNDLVYQKKINNWSCEIVTGENCPNYYTAASLMSGGIDRFQADPCRMMGLIDTVITSCIAKIEDCPITPHAGGSSLDEQSPHIQLFNLARVQTDQDPLSTLTENVGFCSKYFESPTIVSKGLLQTPTTPGLLVGLNQNILKSVANYKDGITWLGL